jgi:hypothetical protein
MSEKPDSYEAPSVEEIDADASGSFPAEPGTTDLPGSEPNC